GGCADAADGEGRPARAGGKTCRSGVVRSRYARTAVVKLLRTIRLDPSDTFVFETAASPGEWAVPGGFVFFATEEEQLAGKARAAFRAVLLGIDSLGWSTLAQVVEASEGDRDDAVALLAQRLAPPFR